MTRISSQSCSNRRVEFLGYAVAIVLVGGLAYAGMLQVVYRTDFAKVAAGQVEDSILPLAGRGRILDDHGRAIALTRTSFKVSIYPVQLRKDGRCARAAQLLAQCCGSDSARLHGEMESRDGMFVFDNDLNFNQGDSLRRLVRRLSLDNCIAVEPQKTRLYPYGDTVGSVLGFAVHDSGRAGIEAVLDPVLAGTPGKVVVQKDVLGNRYRLPAYPDIQPANGADVALTIDLDVQRIAYEELALCVDSFKADAGSAIVMDCPTGEIRAMCDFPYNDPRRSLPKGVIPSYQCLAAEESFEPGSVFKPVMGLAALESDNAKKITNMRYDVSSGVIDVCGKKIHDVHPAGVQDFPGVFIHSSNVGLSMMSMMVDRSRYYETMRKLGIGKLTGIELPAEDSGYIDAEYRTAPGKMSPLRVANNAFGQGVRTTLLQLADCYATIANDGVLHRPYVIKSVSTADETSYVNQPLVLRQAVTAEAAQAMKDILGRVVTEGTGVSAASPYFAICGKTGTAQKAIPGRGYKDGQIIATFVGFFPKQDPKYLVAISVDNPKFGKYAGTIVCPTFRRVCERCWMLNQADYPVAAGHPSNQ